MKTEFKRKKTYLFDEICQIEYQISLFSSFPCGKITVCPCYKPGTSWEIVKSTNRFCTGHGKKCFPKFILVMGT